MNVDESDKPANTEFEDNPLSTREQLRPLAVIEDIAEDLKEAAYLCSELSLRAKDAIIEPTAMKAISELVRRAACRLRDELAAAETRQ